MPVPWRYGPQSSRLEFWFPMAGIQAGVVTEAQVNGLPQQPSAVSQSLQSPATWAYIWVALSFAYLVMIYLGMIRISRRG